MRTTFQSMTLGAQLRLMNRSVAMEAANNRLASGKNFTRASEDPAAAAEALTFRSELGSLDNYKGATDDATAQLQATDTQLQAMQDRMTRLKELVVSAATGTAGPDQRAAVAHEVTSLRDDLVNMANAKYLGQPLFAGFASSDAVVYNAGTSSWQLTGQPTEKMLRSISDTDTVQVNVTSTELFTNGSTTLFAQLDQLVADLNAGNATGIQSAITMVDQAKSTISTAQSRIGAAANRVDNMAARIAAQKVNAQARLSAVEDIDLAQGISEVQRQQAAYQAALGATAKSIQQSLVDWLR
jgi:flagellar hook-associated protein 3 FlgL